MGKKLLNKINSSKGAYEVPEIFITHSSAELFLNKLSDVVEYSQIKQKKWGTHLNTDGSLFYWIFDYIYTPLSATMFALLAFFVASASYRAFRIRNFEATLLLISGIILMLGRVPIGALIPAWIIGSIVIFGLCAILAPFIKNRQILLSLIISRCHNH